MTLLANYDTKKDLKAAIGEPLSFKETSFFEPEYRDNGTFAVCNRPSITGRGREFFAEVTMEDSIIVKVT